MEWQPIETAPKDGTEILIWAKLDHPNIVVGFRQVMGEHSWWSYSEIMLNDIAGEIVSPTHWMPLPAPPEAEK